MLVNGGTGKARFCYKFVRDPSPREIKKKVEK